MHKTCVSPSSSSPNTRLSSHPPQDITTEVRLHQEPEKRQILAAAAADFTSGHHQLKVTPVQPKAKPLCFACKTFPQPCTQPRALPATAGCCPSPILPAQPGPSAAQAVPHARATQGFAPKTLQPAPHTRSLHPDSLRSVSARRSQRPAPQHCAPQSLAHGNGDPI